MAQGENIMIRRMEKAKLLKRTVSQNELGEQVLSYEEQSVPIDVAVSVLQGNYNSANNVLTTASTHIALTHDKRASEGDKIVYQGRNYICNFVNASTRWIQLWLSLEDAL